MDAMKPCPFCGNKDIEIETEKFLTSLQFDGIYKEEYWYRATCVCMTKYYRTEEEAIAEWNKKSLIHFNNIVEV